MKRVILAIVGTVTGLVALLSFKTQQPQAASGALPSAGLPNPASTGTPSTSRASSAAPPSGSRSRTTPAPVTTARTYLGPAITTQYGVVQVQVRVSGTRITNVSLKQLTAFDQHSQDINSAAAPQLLQETLRAQSGRIDTVSGATYTSEGYLQSLQGALDAAGIR